jgi:hypothetical protein
LLKGKAAIGFALPFFFIIPSMNNRDTISWLDYTIINNPQGVAKVLTEQGYVGQMQPQTVEDLYAYSYDLIDKNGDEGTLAILNAHPEYPVFQDIFAKKTPTFNNAIGTQISEFINRSPVNKALVAVVIFAAIYYLIKKPES